MEKCKQSTKGGNQGDSGEVTDNSFVMGQLLHESKQFLILFEPMLKCVSYMIRWAVEGLRSSENFFGDWKKGGGGSA